jgi:hypothetical protein
MLKDYLVKDMTKNLVYEAFIENWVEILRYVMYDKNSHLGIDIP